MWKIISSNSVITTILITVQLRSFHLDQSRSQKSQDILCNSRFSSLSNGQSWDFLNIPGKFDWDSVCSVLRSWLAAAMSQHSIILLKTIKYKQEPFLTDHMERSPPPQQLSISTTTCSQSVSRWLL